MKKIEFSINLTQYNIASALLIALSSRLFIIFNAILGSYFLPIINPNIWDTGLPILNLFARWDAGHYFRIAYKGYDESNLGFFPLYPLLLKIFSMPLEFFIPKLWALNIVGFIISNIFFFISIIGLYKLTYKVFQNDEKVALSSTLFLSFYPASIFLSAVYSESLLLALTLYSFIMLEEKKFLKSATLAFLAGLSRPIGFLSSIPMLLTGIKNKSIKMIALAIFSANSLTVFGTYRYLTIGKFILIPYFAPIMSPTLISTAISNTIQINTALKILSTLIIIAVLASFTKISLIGIGTKYVIYSIALFLTYLFYGSIQGFMRYSIPIIVVYWLLGYIDAKNKVVGIIILCGTSMLLGLLTVIYANWYELP